MSHELTEAGALLAQALLHDPVVLRAIRSGDRFAIARAVEPHGLDAEEALILMAFAAIPGRN